MQLADPGDLAEVVPRDVGGLPRDHLDRDLSPVARHSAADEKTAVFEPVEDPGRRAGREPGPDGDLGGCDWTVVAGDDSEGLQVDGADTQFTGDRLVVQDRPREGVSVPLCK